LSQTADALVLRCGRCRDVLDEEDLFCSNCGAEAPAQPGIEAAPVRSLTVHRFDCSSCGASLVWPAAAQGLRCMFCGRESLAEQPAARVPAPSRVCPFRIDRVRAEAAFREWLGQGAFRPNDLRTGAVLTGMRGVYLPYWSFTVECDTYWTADSNFIPPGAKAEWAPQFGTHRGSYSGTLVPASGALTLREVRGIGAYDLAAAVPYSPEVLGDVPAEPFAVTRKRARLLAREGLEERLRADCKELVPGPRQRNLKLNTLTTGTTAEPVLLPAWILAWEYRGRPFRVLVNGESGKVEGTAPVSPWKVLAAMFAGFWLILALLFLLYLFD
jgi:predicted RNA-binding Zn-ribbon protein involved in translation (DUF1610 family)